MYEYVKAIIDCGTLRWEYQILEEGAPMGRMSHDEDVEGWSDEDIETVTRMTLDVDEAQEIEIIYQ